MPASGRPSSTPGGLPGWLAALGLVGAALVALPIVGLLAEVDWLQFWGRISSPDALEALWLSLRTSLAATALAVLLGVPIAFLLARGRLPNAVATVIRTITLLPLVLPPVVGGLALLATFGRRGLVGGPLSALGIEIGFTTLAVILAQTFVAMPLLVLAIEGALRSRGTALEASALTLGASPSRVFFTVTLPLLRPSLVTGLVLVFARALGEFGATLTFAGSLAGVTRTLPLEIYLQRELDAGTAISVSVLLILVSLVIVAIVYRAPGGPRDWQRTAFRRVPQPDQAGNS